MKIFLILENSSIPSPVLAISFWLICHEHTSSHICCERFHLVVFVCSPLIFVWTIPKEHVLGTPWIGAMWCYFTKPKLIIQVKQLRSMAWPQTCQWDASHKCGMTIVMAINFAIHSHSLTLGLTKFYWWVSQISFDPLSWKAWHAKILCKVESATCGHPTLLINANNGLSANLTSCDNLNPLFRMLSILSSDDFCSSSYAHLSSCGSKRLVHHKCSHWTLELVCVTYGNMICSIQK